MIENGHLLQKECEQVKYTVYAFGRNVLLGHMYKNDIAALL